MRRARWLLLALLFSAAAGLATHYAVESYVIDQAAQDIRDVLLSHRGVHEYIQRTMHPEFYRARREGKIPLDYYAPEILSSSFMVRVVQGYYNEERVKAGLPPVYYKMASDHPRNPVNRADAEELRLLAYFRQHPEAKEYREVRDIDGRTCLVVAMPFLRTGRPCLVCHGDRADAPEGLQARYPGTGGFGERVGGLRAIESLRVPIEQEQVTAWVVTLAALAGFAVLGTLLVFNRSLNRAVRQKTGELSSKERSFRKLLEAADAVPFEYSPGQDRFTYVGQQYQHMFREDPRELRTGADWDRLVHPDDQDTELRACRDAVRTGADHDCRMRIVRRDGTSLVVHQSMKVVQEEGAEPLVVGFIHDATAVTRNDAVQRACLAVARSATVAPLDRLIRSVLEEAEALTESRVGFFHFVDEDQQTLVLRAWTGRPAPTAEGGAAAEVCPLDRAGPWADALRTGETVVHNESAAVGDARGLPEGPEPIVRELVMPLRHGGAVVALIGVANKRVPYDATDVSALDRLAQFALEIVQRKRTEEENARIQDQLAQAQRLEAVGRLAGGVAHDFNNMLSVILGHADLALQQLGPDSPLQEDLSEIQKAAERSAAITKQLLAFARKQQVHPKAVNLNEAIDGILKMLRRLIGEDIDLVWHPHTGLRTVFIDPSQLDQILANLATNARDAIAGVGTLRIETKNVDVGELESRMRAGRPRPGGYVLLAVHDSGGGIAPEDLTNIFEPFYTTKESGRGTGLGLATVLGIVKQNGGFIDVASEPARGTTFEIYLPACDEAPAEPAEAVEPERDLSGTETVLLVEDEPAMLRLGEKILRALGYRVLPAGEPAEALAVAAGFADRIDLLVTDVVMPGMNGRQLAERLCASRPGLKCLYVSGYTANVMMDRGIPEGADPFVPKPFSAAELGRKVRDLLDA